jgi:hypothetical protein
LQLINSQDKKSFKPNQEFSPQNFLQNDATASCPEPTEKVNEKVLNQLMNKTRQKTLLIHLFNLFDYVSRKLSFLTEGCLM